MKPVIPILLLAVMSTAVATGCQARLSFNYDKQDSIDKYTVLLEENRRLSEIYRVYEFRSDTLKPLSVNIKDVQYFLFMNGVVYQSKLAEFKKTNK